MNIDFEKQILFSEKPGFLTYFSDNFHTSLTLDEPSATSAISLETISPERAEDKQSIKEMIPSKK